MLYLIIVWCGRVVDAVHFIQGFDNVEYFRTEVLPDAYADSKWVHVSEWVWCPEHGWAETLLWGECRHCYAQAEGITSAHPWDNDFCPHHDGDAGDLYCCCDLPPYS